MKLQVTQENLNKALGYVAKVASTRNTLPILSNILIKTVDNRVCVAATNLNIAITHYIGSKVTSGGAITVPAKLTQDFIASLPSGVVNIDLDENKLHISTDKYNSTINGSPAEEYPVMPAIKNGKSWKIKTSELKKALIQTVFSASNDDARPTLTGVYLYTKDSELFCVSTDSYRLSERKITKLNQEVNLNIPASAIADLIRVLPDDKDQETSITHDDQQALFKTGDTELVARLIEGNYPDYQKLIPEKFFSQANLDKDDFINITKVSSLFARESAGSITIEIEDKGKISIKSIASQLGENTAEAEAEVIGAGKITLNSRYLLDALNSIEENKITIGFNGKLEPCVIKPHSHTNHTCIVMPLKS